MYVCGGVVEYSMYVQYIRAEQRSRLHAVQCSAVWRRGAVNGSCIYLSLCTLVQTDDSGRVDCRVQYRAHTLYVGSQTDKTDKTDKTRPAMNQSKKSTNK